MLETRTSPVVTNQPYLGIGSLTAMIAQAM
jgi:hypothetical protein